MSNDRYEKIRPMTAEAELLPLPEGYDKYNPPHLYEGKMFHEGQMRAYARANTARAIAPLQAEIEALRAEVAVWKLSFEQAASGHAFYAEQLEKLQVELAEWKSRAERDEALLRQALDALIWTTGSADFSEGGIAREGALKLLFPTITALREHITLAMRKE